MRTHFFSGTGKLLGLMMRQDRIKLPIWILSISLFVIAVGAAFPSLYASQAELDAFRLGLENPAMVAMFGPVFGDVYTYGVAMANQMLLFIMIFTAVMSIFLVASHTRGEEEEGILELIRAQPVGRLANLASAWLLMVLANGLLGLMTALGLILIGLEGMNVIGSLTFGVAMALGGILMGSITALIVQLFENNRLVLGTSFLVLGVMFVMRGIGDVADSFLVWVTPLNWPIRSQVYVNNLIWPLGLTFVFSLMMMVIAVLLNARRDLEAGIIPQKLGRYAASRLTKTPFGFLLKLQRTAWLAWLATAFVLGISYGIVFGDLDTYFTSNELLVDLLPGGVESLSIQFMTVLMVVMAILSTVGPIMFVNRLATEEKKNHTEHIFARSMAKSHFMIYALLLSSVAAFTIMLSSILGLYTGIVASMDDPLSFGILLKAGLAYMPAILFFVGLSSLLVAYRQRLVYLSYLYLAVAFMMLYFGPILNVPALLIKLTPFGYVDRLPLEPYRFIHTFLLSSLTLGMILLSIRGYARRDLTG